jgi:hypothetical protein
MFASHPHMPEFSPQPWKKEIGMPKKKKKKKE